MAAVPVKPQYGPTLGRLLSPRWRAASTLLRATVIAVAVAAVVLLAAATLTLLSPTYSHGGAVPFHFSYRDLYRTAPGRGEFVRVQRLSPEGRLKDSLAVGPVGLPPYTGELSAELPLYTAGLIGQLSRSYDRFALRGEGKSTVNSVPAYNIYFSARVQGQTMYGRQVLVFPQRRGAREGVSVTMLTLPSPSARSPLEMASVGALAEALKSLTLG